MDHNGDPCGVFRANILVSRTIMGYLTFGIFKAGGFAKRPVVSGSFCVEKCVFLRSEMSDWIMILNFFFKYHQSKMNDK